jgi:hypothetical protein
VPQVYVPSVFNVYKFGISPAECADDFVLTKKKAIKVKVNMSLCFFSRRTGRVEE